MRRLIAGLTIAGLATPTFARTASGVPASRPEISGCAVFDAVDVAALPKAAPLIGPMVDAALRARHADWTPTTVADAEVVLDAVDPMSRARTTLIAQRSQGAWRVSAVRSAAAGAPETKSATLSPNDAATVDDILADACLWSTPPILPNQVPLKDGKVAVCYDGLDTILRIRSGEKRWDGEEKCRVVGLPYRLSLLLWNATLMPSASGRATMIRDAEPRPKP